MTNDHGISYAQRNVPRYTSYPTAPHFSDAVGAQTYAGWLAKLDRRTPVSLYMHVPFCKQLCWYCGCNMRLAKRDRPVLDYAAQLAREVDLLAERLPGRLQVSHLHWGGGTPTILSSASMGAVMDRLHDRFEILPQAELAIESDPRSLQAGMIAWLGAQGFTRASFGVQEFDHRVQCAINRVQPPDMVRDAVIALRRAGIRDINFDLIYGLPHQTVATLLHTIKLCVEIRPNRIALFGYAHVPWMAKKQRMIDEAALPGPTARRAQAEAAAEALVAAGYVRIGLDHFALHEDAMAIAATSGTLRRNFQGYTTDQAETLLGLGASSISRTPSGYAQNISEPGGWGRQIDADTLPIARGVAFAGDDALRGYVIERLMCAGQVDLWRAADRFGAGRDWYADSLAALDQMAADGLLRLSDGTLLLTPEGRMLVRVVAAAFDAYLPHQATQRHAAAV